MALIVPHLSSPLMEEGGDPQFAHENTISSDKHSPGAVGNYSRNPENCIGRYFYEDMQGKMPHACATTS